MIKEARPHTWTKLTSYPWTTFLLGSVLTGIGLWLYRVQSFPAASYTLTFTFISLGFGGWVIAAMSPHFWLSQTQVPGIKLIASLAFALYLTHKQMIRMGRDLVPDYINHQLVTIFVVSVLTMASALLLHFGVERPFLRLREFFLQKKELATSGLRSK